VIDDVRERRAWSTDQQILIDFLQSPAMRVPAATRTAQWTDNHAD